MIVDPLDVREFEAMELSALGAPLLKTDLICKTETEGSGERRVRGNFTVAKRASRREHPATPLGSPRKHHDLTTCFIYVPQHPVYPKAHSHRLTIHCSLNTGLKSFQPIQFTRRGYYILNTQYNNNLAFINNNFYIFKAPIKLQRNYK